MNKEAWRNLTQFCSFDYFPTLPCPYCNSENLAIDKESFCTRELSEEALRTYIKLFSIKGASVNANGENIWISILELLIEATNTVMYKPAQFIAFFKCSICNGSVSSIGVAKIPRKDTSGFVQLKVESFNPSVPMFQLNTETPKIINEELLGAFKYFHSDICASGYRLRRAIEKICKELGFSNGNLHRNIEAMGKEFPKEAGWLESLKLLGNEAIHSDNVSADDLLHSFEIIEIVLNIFKMRNLEKVADKSAKLIDDKFNKNRS